MLLVNLKNIDLKDIKLNIGIGRTTVAVECGPPRDTLHILCFDPFFVWIS